MLHYRQAIPCPSAQLRRLDACALDRGGRWRARRLECCLGQVSLSNPNLSHFMVRFNI